MGSEFGYQRFRWIGERSKLGHLEDVMFDGVSGSLSLWGFSTSIDSLGIALPTTYLELDDGACHDSSPLRGEDGGGWLALLFAFI